MNRMKKFLIISFLFWMAFSSWIESGDYGCSIPDQVYADTTVYVTPTGSKYHAYACGRGNYSPVSLSEAKARGLGPCKRCNPPTSSSSETNAKTKSKKTSDATNIQLNKKSIVLTVGKNVKLKVKGTSSKVAWKSNNKKIATVDSKGKVKAVAKGKTTIQAVVGGKTLTCKVKVEKPILSDASLEMHVGEEAYIELKGCSHDIEWESDDYEIADVDDGEVFANEEGTTVIYATVHDKAFACTVTVLPAADDTEDPFVETIFE